MAIKAIVFDIAGVLIDESSTKARELTLKQLKISNEYTIKSFKEFAIKNIESSYKGKLDYNIFFKKFVNQYDLEIKPEKFITEWLNARRKISKLKKDTLRILNELKSRYITVSFTNTTELNDIVRNEIRIYKYFDINLRSCRKCFMKPELSSYRLLIKILRKKKINSDEIIFIDNEENNLKPAGKLGINTILFENAGKLKKDLKKFGVEI